MKASPRALAVFASGLQAFTGCGSEAPSSEPLGTLRAPIVGGQLEQGWSGVGALVRTDPIDGYRGVFCSATVVAPRWAVTAAHCIRTEEFEPWPTEVQLFLGTDGRPTANGEAPTSGSLHQVGALIAHPSYERGRDFDIGLVYLIDPVSDPPATQLNTAPLTNWSIDAEVLFVGFGVDDADAITGDGLKRSVALPLVGYEDGFFFSEPAGSGFCYGDSGGPAILDAGTEPRIAGVASRFEGEPFCVGGYSISTRIDTNLEWLESTMAAPPPGCDTHEGRCACDAACQSDGTCDAPACDAAADGPSDEDGGCATRPISPAERAAQPWMLLGLALLLKLSARGGAGA